MKKYIKISLSVAALSFACIVMVAIKENHAGKMTNCETKSRWEKTNGL